jgi:hypothetical protein
VPVVNVRFVAWLARRRGVLSDKAAETFVRDARNVFYMDRTWDDVVKCAPAHARTAVQGIAQTHGDLKRLDARFALRSTLRYVQRTRAAGKPG